MIHSNKVLKLMLVGLNNLIETFEGKIATSRWISGYIKGRQAKPENKSTDNTKFDQLKGLTSHPDNQEEDLNYCRIFHNATTGANNQDQITILTKILVQLDLLFLIKPETIINFASGADKELIPYTHPDENIIFSPFVRFIFQIQRNIKYIHSKRKNCWNNHHIKNYISIY